MTPDVYSMGSIFKTMFLFAFVATAAATIGCGGAKSKKDLGLGESGGARVGAGDRVTVAGTLSLRGNMPHPVVILELENGGLAVIQSSEFQGELEALAGMRVKIEGEVLPSPDDEPPTVKAHRYQMLPLPSGEVPIVGVLNFQEDQCLLEAADGKRYWLRGDFVTLLADFVGAKVWVVGKVGEATLPEQPADTAPLWVTGYGVLSE
jgi:hypothetical protein